MMHDRDRSEGQSVLIVTGLSGAGKSTALQVLDDLGWETIDNFPVRLLSSLLAQQGDTRLAVGFDSRTRGFDSGTLAQLDDDLSSGGIEMAILFLDAASTEIERRYNETRRPHPLARGRPIVDGIAADREMLAPLRRRADIVIDTTNLSVHQLQQTMRERFAAPADTGLTITITSFGFARGMPPLADLVFDMRFLDNPHWVPGLREQTGLDGDVAQHIDNDPGFGPAFAKMADLLLDLLPRYEAQGRSYLNIAFGCTGGRHRSVYTAERAGQVLRDAGFSPTIQHRNLGSRPADPLERR
ncbi:RNase adapter RapZ [Erythrobacter litoralis]|uniref:RNase adapter RapZ n=1 Tax=Erythrobacter litoralis TaxID=39960 RepID=UPI002435466D|nr:RNase adapter RapZ [Erythrobacter litoralis]MDG6078772.1 RNase adapter RapZ [Erythrobacter litoralis]